MKAIKSIGFRRVLNSHAQFTTEFHVQLDDGRRGAAASPQGETTSIYEGDGSNTPATDLIAALNADGWVGRPATQEDIDGYLDRRMSQFGRSNCFALSLAFFEANRAGQSGFDLWNGGPERLSLPRLCCNILNGGRHAYTNPVLSDFPEYLLVARSNLVDAVIEAHLELQRVVREKLRRCVLRDVGGNPVHCFGTADNRECLDFLLQILEEMGLTDQFDLMIDASAGDLWTHQGYRLAITDGSLHSCDQFVDYWLRLIRDYDIRFLEDPLGERDPEHWPRLTASQLPCSIIGDNFYSSDAARIRKGAAAKCTHGVIIKPNQAGTVTGARRALEAARSSGQTVITSHRSVSTEETFVSTLTCLYRVPYTKIGPLFTDYSSVLRLNEMIRLVDESLCHQKPLSAPSVMPTRSTMPSVATPAPWTSR